MPTMISIKGDTKMDPDRDPLLHHEPKDVHRGVSEGRPKPLGDQEQPALGSGRPDGRGRLPEPDGPRRGKPRGRPADRSEHHPPHGRQAVDPTDVPMGGAKPEYRLELIRRAAELTSEL